MVLFFFVLVSFSQNTTLDKLLGYNDTYLWFTGASTDVITTTDTTWMYTVRKKTDSKTQCYVDMLIDSTGGTANNVVIVLQNKKFPDTDFVTVATVTWDGGNTTALGEIVSFEPSSQSFTFASVGVDSISGTIALDTLTLTSLTDTTGLAGYPADSIITGVPPQAGTFTATVTPTGLTMTATESDQFNMGEYWRVLVTGADNTLLAAIRRLNFKFVNP